MEAEDVTKKEYVETLTEDQQLALLMRAIANDPLLKRQIAEEITKENKEEVERKKVNHVRARQFKTVRKVRICQHCGAEKVIVMPLQVDESTTIVAKNGTHTRITYQNVEDMAEVKTYTGYCDNCRAYLKTLSRADLEGRYIELLLLATASIARGGLA